MPFDNLPLSDDDLRAQAPSVFATMPAPSVSERYAFLPSYPVVRMLRVLGIHPVEARQGTKRAPDGREYAIHRLRFRKIDDSERWANETRSLGSVIPEVLLLNSHDRTSTMQFSGGLMRLVCLNGMTVMEAGMSFKARHTGKSNIGDVVGGVQSIMKNFTRMIEVVQDWDGLSLSIEQEFAFASAAYALRGSAIDVHPRNVLRDRREEDMGTSLWKVFNRVQENLTRGGLGGRSAGGGYRTLRPIRSLVVDEEFNRQLWTMASGLAREIRPATSVVVG